MSYKLNHISRGAWYIYRKSDLDLVRCIFSDFYESAIVPVCGELRKFVFVYNIRSGVAIIRKCGRLKKYRVNLMRDRDFAKKMYYMLDTLAATGIVSAPFYLVEIKFRYPKSNKGNDILIYKGGKRLSTGYYHLKGILT